MSDDCGDQSDEALALCESRNHREDETYFQDTFEETDEKFFHNDPNQPSNWIRGSGDQLLKARSPAFDHSYFSDKGHYMRLDMKNAAGDRDGLKHEMMSATFVSELMQPPLQANETCRIRFYFHFTMEVGLNMTFSLAVR